MIEKRKILICPIFLILFHAAFWAQTYSIDYYGIVSTQIDSNMSKMTSDLYYTQLTEINNFSVSDMRNGTFVYENEPDNTSFSETKLSFYALISKDEKTEKWTTVFRVIDKNKNEEHSKTKVYDSFYKILMEPKSVLQETIRNLIESDANVTELQKTAKAVENARHSNINSTEELSGTWSGEASIDKIVILRGGRGFVIFKNGASMNIGIELSGDGASQSVIITQKGRSNASFYPELPRSIALNAAVSAEPISWVLNPVDGSTLEGTKNTLVQNGDSYEEGTISVEWKRVN